MRTRAMGSMSGRTGWPAAPVRRMAAESARTVADSRDAMGRGGQGGREVWSVTHGPDAGAGL